jgi:hypothetical protein
MTNRTRLFFSGRPGSPTASIIVACSTPSASKRHVGLDHGESGARLRLSVKQGKGAGHLWRDPATRRTYGDLTRLCKACV